MELILNKYINIPIVKISVKISKNIEIIPNFIPKLVLFFIIVIASLTIFSYLFKIRFPKLNIRISFPYSFLILKLL